MASDFSRGFKITCGVLAALGLVFIVLPLTVCGACGGWMVQQRAEAYRVDAGPEEPPVWPGYEQDGD